MHWQYRADAHRTDRIDCEDLVEPVTAYVGLGSNLGDRAANLWTAVQRMADLADCRLLRLSPLYESEPIGPVPQGPFLNAVAAVRTGASPLELLRALQGIEAAMGRIPTVRWGPRLIDLDLLLHGDAHASTEELTLPHPELWSRRFVLVPLLDVLSDGGLRQKAEKQVRAIGESQGLWLHGAVSGSLVRPSADQL